jgi:hypothetical protein
MVRTLSVVLIMILVAGCAAHVVTRPQPETDDRVGASAADVWYVPGRALVCVGAAALSVVTMTVTFGQEYETASEIMHGGCSGPWLVRPQEIRDAARSGRAPL